MAKNEGFRGYDGDFFGGHWETPQLIDPRGMTGTPEELRAADEVLRRMTEQRAPVRETLRNSAGILAKMRAFVRDRIS